ncbi:MAG: DUF2934 domain-containing protein [Gemmataceae bacterium]|nr:DUF2934 domain-containing protein [Gemmataceae bacterium]
MSQHSHNTSHPPPPPPPPFGTPTGAPITDATEERLQHGGVTFEEAVRVRAYNLWERAGRPEGNGREYWLEAEAVLTAVR